MKGFRNNGENNWFLNAILQAFWNLASFKEQVYATDLEHPHDCKWLYWELKCILAEYEFGDEKTLDSGRMRQALNFDSLSGTEFAIDMVADAVEAFDEFLMFLHRWADLYYSQKAHEMEEFESEVWVPIWLSHKIFGMLYNSTWYCPRDDLKGTDNATSTMQYTIKIYTQQIIEFEGTRHFDSRIAETIEAFENQKTKWPKWN